MKKSLLALSAVVIMFNACNSSSKISDEATKKFENSLNTNLNKQFEEISTLASLLLGQKLNITNQGYVCENKKDFISCTNPLISVDVSLLDETKKVNYLNIKNIKLETNAIYSGDKQGIISIEEAVKAMPKDIFYNSQIEGLELGEGARAFVTLFSMQDRNFDIFSKLAYDTYKINSTTKASNIQENGYVNTSMKINGVKNNNEISIELGFNTLKDFLKVLDANNVKYNTNASFLEGEENLYNADSQDFLNHILIKNINSKINISNDLSFLKKIFANELTNAPEPFKSIADNFFNKKPHELSQSLEIKNNFNILKALEDNEKGLLTKEQEEQAIKNIDFKINGIDIIKALNNDK